MDIRTVNNIRCYSGDITPESGVVFVFGSNPEGRHGAGAAKVARERFGAVYGRGEGLQGNAYALPTKDLRVTENRGFRSISPETITQSIKRLYETARQHPDKSFCIAYRNTDRASLNGYTGIEMMRMFNAAGPMPANVIVSEEWAKTGILKKNAELEFLTEGNDSILKQYDAYRVIVPGINLAVDTRMDNVRDWYELVNDNGERLVRAANYVTGDLRSYDSAHFENATIGPDGSITLDAVAHSTSPEGDVETSERSYRVTFTRKELMEMTSKDISDTKDLILDVDGSPKLLWHGSPAEFDIFDFSHAGENTGLVEYTDRRTGEKVVSDSDKALFFTDNRELAISYAFLARTQQLSRYNDILTDIGSLLNNPEGSIISRIHSKAELIDAVKELRREGDAQMNAVLDKLPDLTADKPLSSMEASARKALAKDVFKVRNRYSEYYRKNALGGLSNQLNNFVLQKNYLAYFAENLDRLCANDPTVHTQFDEDFNSYANSFFGPDHGSGIYVFLERETRRMKASGFRKEPVYLDTLTASDKRELLQKIEDDLNACIESYNKDIDEAGFMQSTHLYPVYLKTKNPLVHDYQGSAFPDKYMPNEKYDTAYIAARQVKKALADGNDAVVYKNISDSFLSDSYGVFSKDSIVMVDRSLLPDEQLDSTLGKATGTVQRYMDSRKTGKNTTAGNDIYSHMRKEAEQKAKEHPNADPGRVDDLFTTIDKEEEENKLRTLGHDALKRANEALKKGNRAEFDRLYAESGRYEKEAEAIEKMSLEEYREKEKDYIDAHRRRATGNERETVSREQSAHYPTPVTRSDGRMNYRDANGNALLRNWVEKAEPFENGNANVVFGGLHFTINDKGVVTKREERIVNKTTQSTGTKTKIR